MGDVLRPEVVALQSLLARPEFPLEQMDGVLDVPPGSVLGWRDGSVRIPKKDADSIITLHAYVEYDRKVEALGLPECAEQERLWAEMDRRSKENAGEREQSKAFSTWARHKRKCPTCRANTERISREVGPTPFEKKIPILGPVLMQLTGRSFPPWTLAISIPLFVLCVYSAVQPRGPEARSLVTALTMSAGLLVVPVYLAASELLRDFRDRFSN